MISIRLRSKKSNFAVAPSSEPLQLTAVSKEVMKILILGGTIFLGHHLIEAALARGHQITRSGSQVG